MRAGKTTTPLVEPESREAKMAAPKAFFAKYCVGPLDAETAARVEAEWHGTSSQGFPGLGELE